MVEVTMISKPGIFFFFKYQGAEGGWVALVSISRYSSKDEI